MKKKLNFMLDLVGVFTDYSKDLDNYFSIKENQDKNYQLYKLYTDLKLDILNLSEKYGVDKCLH